MLVDGRGSALDSACSTRTQNRRHPRGHTSAPVPRPRGIGATSESRVGTALLSLGLGVKAASPSATAGVHDMDAYRAVVEESLQSLSS